MNDAAPTADAYPIYLAGRWVDSPRLLEVGDPAHADVLAGTTYLATPAQYEEAADAAVRGFEEMRALPTYARAAALRHVSAGIAERRDEIAELITRESGKSIRDARVETERGVLVFRLAAEEAERLGGETMPLDIAPAHKGRQALTRRFPVGPVAAISPFNFPLNLAAHKVAPAIAAGCSIVLKPPSRDPLTMLTVARIIDRAGLPPGAVSVLPMERSLGDRLVADERFRLLTFTGSPAVGWRMKERAGRKPVVLELGGNAGAIIDASADLDWAVKRTLVGAFAFSGQVCISVQRLLVHASVWERFLERFVAAAEGLKLGDPLDPDTDIGPMVDKAAVERTERWVAEAVADGAKVLTGGTREGLFFRPTVLVEAARSSQVCSEEAFAPLVVAFPFDDIEEAFAEVNASRFGLQAGVFTNDLAHAWRAFETLEVGGVVINDVPTYRVDHMPYGGVKESGIGREGLRWAIEDMTELRLMVMAQPG
ncbi:MAG: aldehyde dehydrogenase family protein [Chloroflexota bacterium]|jgi:glyceraldehyde-3-phosphate dehydrogenase (NADP+)